MTDITNTCPDFRPREVRVLMQKTERKQIWSFLSDYQDGWRWHIREVYINGRGQWAPGKQGISVPATEAPTFRASIAA